MKILVTIANHGTGNREFLDQLLAAYRNFPIEVDLIVVSNIPKDLGLDVEVVVGVPTENPWSLPFAHRPIFKEKLDQYDLFIYSEDDTLITWANIKAFLEECETLEENEIPGFLRTEKGPDGRKYFSTCHSFFRWIPGSVVSRNGKLWAKYSNEHAACFVATKKQLAQAIRNEGFPSEPHEGRFDMLCSAATDIYTKGGLNRLVCLDRIPEFSLPHLPNKYIGKMGLPAEEMEWQIEALRLIDGGKLPKVELVNPETKLPGCVGSKLYRETSDPIWSELLGEKPLDILVWGAGDGQAELSLRNNEHSVTMLPLDSIMGECCRKRGFHTLELTHDYTQGIKAKFDCIIASNLLHLVDDPIQLMKQFKELLRPGGKLLARVPNFNNFGLRRRRAKDPRYQIPWNRKSIGASPLTKYDLKQMATAAGFSQREVIFRPKGKLKYLNRISLGLFSSMLSPTLYLWAKK